MRKPTLTIVTPVYNEEDNLLAFREEVERVLFPCDTCDIDVLFIEDGSHDGSWSRIALFCRESPRFRAIRLSRNFGAHTALSCGIASADTDAVVTLACDLQDPPAVILEFLEKWRQGAKIVWGWRRRRDDQRWRIMASELFCWVLRVFALPRDSQFTTGSFFLMDKKVVSCFRRFHERNRLTFALVAWTGFSQDKVFYDRRRRAGGRSGWTRARMFKAMYDAVVGFTTLPIRLMIYIGLGVSCANVFFLLYLLTQWINGTPAPGWTSVMFTITFFFGVLFLLVGMVGEYLSRIYTEVIHRPLYFISDTANIAAPPEPDDDPRRAAAGIFPGRDA